MQTKYSKADASGTDANNRTDRSVFWQSHLDRWRQSGLSQAQYCRQNDLVYHQMVYWARKHRDAAAPTPDSGSSNFLPVVVEQLPLDQQVRLVLPNGLELQGISRRSMEMVIRIIESI